MNPFWIVTAVGSMFAMAPKAPDMALAARRVGGAQNLPNYDLVKRGDGVYKLVNRRTGIAQLYWDGDKWVTFVPKPVSIKWWLQPEASEYFAQKENILRKKKEGKI